MNFSYFKSGGDECFSIPDDGPDISEVIRVLENINGAKVESLDNVFGETLVTITEGSEQVLIFYEPMGGIILRWPETQPKSKLFEKILDLLAVLSALWPENDRTAAEPPGSRPL